MIPQLFHLASFATLYKYIAWGVSHLGLWSLMLLSAFGAGGVFLRRFQFHSPAERLVFTLALGMGLWALALFVLGLCGALYGGVIWGLTTAAAATTVFYLIHNQSLRLSVSPSWKEYLRPRRLMVFGVAALALAYAGLLLLAASYPPMHWDALAGHLPLARQYLIEHRIVALRGGGAFPLLPALNHMLFAWGRRQQRPGLGLAAAALWLSHPLVLWLGESAYVDVGTTCFAFLGVYALRVFWDKREDAWWLLASALFGMAAGSKMPALFFVGAGAVFGLWARLGSRITWSELAKGW